MIHALAGFGFPSDRTYITQRKWVCFLIYRIFFMIPIPTSTEAILRGDDAIKKKLISTLSSTGPRY